MKGQDFARIKWNGFEVEMWGYVSGFDVEFTSIVITTTNSNGNQEPCDFLELFCQCDFKKHPLDELEELFIDYLASE